MSQYVKKHAKTDGKYKYQPVWIAQEGEYATEVLVSVRSFADAHIWLATSTDENCRSKGYEIVLGAHRNTWCAIRKGRRQMDRIFYEGEVLKGQSAAHFWLACDRQTNDVPHFQVDVGVGHTVGSGRIMSLSDINFKNPILHVSVCTSNYCSGYWTVDVKVQNEDDPEPCMELRTPTALVSASSDLRLRSRTVSMTEVDDSKDKLQASEQKVGNPRELLTTRPEPQRAYRTRTQLSKGLATSERDAEHVEGNSNSRAFQKERNAIVGAYQVSKKAFCSWWAKA